MLANFKRGSRLFTDGFDRKCSSLAHLIVVSAASFYPQTSIKAGSIACCQQRYSMRTLGLAPLEMLKIFEPGF